MLHTAGLVAALALTAGAAEPPPNVLVVFLDDLRADALGAYGNAAIRTPNLDRLAHEGLAFDAAYLQGGLHGATCVPSRAMLLSSRSLFRCDEQLLRDETWPQAFARAGYATFATGKWHNGKASLPRCFAEARALFLGGMTNPLEAPLDDLVSGQLARRAPSPRHACATFADEAIAFLRREHERPFFCYLAFDGPHDPHVVPTDYPVRYAPEELPLPASFLPQHPFDNGEMLVRDERLLGWPRTPEEVRGMQAEYWRYISYLDEEIGRVLDALDASPAGPRTIVVFSSDSGVARGSHGLIGKQSCYEHSMRVPLVLRGPGIPRGARTQALCYLHDLLPTLGALCGVAAPATSEGRDLRAVLADPAARAREHLVLAYRDVQRAVRDERWKLISYPRIDRTQLFDLANDPHETRDLSADPAHAARVTALLATLGTELTALGDRAPLVVDTPQPATWHPPQRR
ncbi:MAG: sulfatase-like hydrolase/transferase [Planctomycetes bacterium]|nr:sulfatase-like hydrolase/transferase [Planctomycetota bacterium]